MGGYGLKGYASTGISPFDWGGVNREGGENDALEIATHRKYLTAEEAKLLFTLSKKSKEQHRQL